MTAADRLTGTNVILGTPGFIAPEILAGEPVTPQVDLYALGVVLVYAATAAVPVRTQEGLDRSWEASLGPEYASLLPVLRRCLRDHPEHRPEGAAWVEARLREADLRVRGPVSSEDPTATHTLELSAVSSPDMGAGSGPSAAAAAASRRPGSVGPQPGRSRWRVAAAGALVGGLAGLLGLAVRAARLQPAYPPHEAGAEPRELASDRDGAEIEGAVGDLHWRLTNGEEGDPWSSLDLMWTARFVERKFRRQAGGDAGFAWDDQGGILALSGGPSGRAHRQLLAFDFEGRLLWIREVRGAWRLHEAWVSLRSGGHTAWMDRRTGRIFRRGI